MSAREVVVDSSVMVKWFIPEDYHEEAKALLRDHLMGEVTAVAPKYALVEFANALRKYLIRGLIDRANVGTIYGLLLESSPRLIDEDGGLVRRALEYSLREEITVYDSCYVMVARELETAFYTADERLLRRLRGRERVIRHIREYLAGGP